MVGELGEQAGYMMGWGERSSKRSGRKVMLFSLEIAHL